MPEKPTPLRVKSWPAGPLRDSGAVDPDEQLRRERSLALRKLLGELGILLLGVVSGVTFIWSVGVLAELALPGAFLPATILCLSLALGTFTWVLAQRGAE